MTQTKITGFSLTPKQTKRTFVRATRPIACKRSSLLATFSLALLLALVFPAFGADLAKAEGKVLLRISGNISKSNSESGIEIDQAMLDSLPVVTFSTPTPWTEGNSEWSGVRLNEFLDYIGAQSRELHIKALDGYEVDFKNVDLDKYPVIIAYKLNGEYMSVRDLGPLWIMFPFADHPELDIQFNRSLSVWQLLEIEVR